MDKLYHCFYCSDYELHSHINLSFYDLVDEVEIDIEDLREVFGDDERSLNIPDEEWYNLTDLELLDLIPDDILDSAIENFFYPRNTYAYYSYSNYEVYETTESGKLKEINPCKIPGFNKAVRESLREQIEKYG